MFPFDLKFLMEYHVAFGLLYTGINHIYELPWIFVQMHQVVLLKKTDKKSKK